MPNGYGINILPAPVLEINTADKNLNGVEMPLKFSCRSTLSKMDNGSAPVVTAPVTVTYVDECSESPLYPANTQDATMLLYEVGGPPFVVPFSTFSCGEFTSSLVYPDDHPFNTAPTFSINAFDGVVMTISDSRDNIGSFPLKIESCITIYSSGELRCVMSDEFTVTIIDPCPLTTISATGFNTVMGAPQLGFNSLTLGAVIPPGGWPWVTQLDIKTGGNFGPNLCGPIDYAVFRKFGTAKEETTLVTLTGGD